MSLIDHIHRCQSADMRKVLPWLIAGETAGWVRRDVAARLGKYPTVFACDDKTVRLRDHLASSITAPPRSATWRAISTRPACSRAGATNGSRC